MVWEYCVWKEHKDYVYVSVTTYYHVGPDVAGLGGHVQLTSANSAGWWHDACWPAGFLQHTSGIAGFCPWPTWEGGALSFPFSFSYYWAFWTMRYLARPYFCWILKPAPACAAGQPCRCRCRLATRPSERPKHTSRLLLLWAGPYRAGQNWLTCTFCTWSILHTFRKKKKLHINILEENRI